MSTLAAALGILALPGCAGLLLVNRRLRAHVRQSQSRLHSLELRGSSESARAGRERFAKELLLSLQGAESIGCFGDALLGGLCRQLDACAGVFHVREGESEHYRLGASWASGSSPAFVERFRSREGVAGQAVAERKTFVCRGRLADFLWIESATQASAACTVIVAPILAGEHVSGVFEIAFLREPGPQDEALIAEVMPVVALSLDLLLGNERARAELAHHRALEELHTCILANVADGIFGQDGEGRVSFVNAAALRMLGYEEFELMGKPMHALTHPHRVDGPPGEPSDCPIRQCQRDGQRRSGDDAVFWRRDGTALPVEYTVSAIAGDGGIPGVVVNFRPR